jgi:hypothetical protein
LRAGDWVLRDTRSASSLFASCIWLPDFALTRYSFRPEWPPVRRCERKFAVSNLNKLSTSLLMSPVLWGVAAAFLFYMPINSGQISQPVIVRYFAGNWVEQVIAGLFFVGVASVALKAMNLYAQFQVLRAPLLDAIPPGGQPITMCDALLQRLDNQPPSLQDGYLIRRLRESLEFVYRKNNGDTLEDELRALSRLDLVRMRSGFSFLRVVTWSIPVLGFLGIVVGLNEAAAGLVPQAIEESLPAVTAGVMKGFDALSLALSLTLLLVVGRYFAEHLEMQLVSAVDARVAAEMVGRFEPSVNTASSAEVITVRRIADETLKSTEQLVTRQTELWQTAFIEAQKQWSQWSEGASKQLQDSLAESLSKTMQDHAAAIVAGQIASLEHNGRQWHAVQQALLQNAEAVTLQQRELVKQGEMLTQVIAATGQVEKLEDELNRNLSTLAGAKNFEQTVLSLGAAIQLLNAKLGSLPSPTTPQVDLKSKRGSKAA